ncbi:uncharacterized protein LOC128236602 isoform X2 [Mya arenaria]|nr:uncharacterized protein LOC128236602 isoform X2 [Mya arenaria]
MMNEHYEKDGVSCENQHSTDFMCQQTEDDEGETSVTYQIIGQQMTEDGQMQLTLSDGVNIIQTTMASEQLHQLEFNDGVQLQTSDQKTGSEVLESAADLQSEVEGESRLTDVQLDSGTPTSSLRQAIQDSIGDNLQEMDHQSDTVTQPNIPAQLVPALHRQSASVAVYVPENQSLTDTQISLPASDQHMNMLDVINTTSTSQSFTQEEFSVSKLQPETHVPETDITQSAGHEVGAPVTETSVKEETKVKQPDLSHPIEVTDHMEVMVKGRKCMLKVNPDTGQLCAYPLITPGKKRGRPRKMITEKKSSPEIRPKPQELSVAGDDDVRRTTRRQRTKPKTFCDYEVYEVTSDDDAAIDEGEDEVLPTGAVRRRKNPANKEYIPPTPIHVPGTVKRGRGRPRRYPRPEDKQPVNQISAMIIPTSDGQTIMMAPIQGLTNLEDLQQQLRNVPLLQGHGEQDGSQFLNIAGLVDSSGDGNMVSIQFSTGVDSHGNVQLRPLEPDTSTTPAIAGQPTILAPMVSQETTNPTHDGLTQSLTLVQEGSVGPGVSSDTLPTSIIDTKQETDPASMVDQTRGINTVPVLDPGVEGEGDLASDVPDEIETVGADLLNGEEEMEEDTSTDIKSVLGDADPALVSEDMIREAKDEISTDNFTPMSADELGETGVAKTDISGPTIIRIPETLLPMFTQKKEPVAIGLKASELQLEKLKCPKCDFQCYYEQQYQDHIGTHGDLVHHCKCCNYVSFSKQELVSHFKKVHPRCICSFCDFMADQAYIIKRHMMRHTQEGCRCDICGKVYKDTYVMKMHVKMVHMPAEVLYECNTCSKKFSRKAHLKRHLRIHEPEKPYKCPHCLYRGCERSDINKHMLIHEDPKHACEVCGKNFRHMKNKDLHMKRHSGQRDYKCGVCDFYGYTFTDIRKHIERKHTDNKTYVCDKCGSIFRSEMLLRDHKSVCDVMMIEQALAIARSDGGTTQATITFPCNFNLPTTIVAGQSVMEDGGQSVISEGGELADDGQADTVTENTINLTEDQMRAIASGELTEEDLQMLVSQSQISPAELQAAVSQGHVTPADQEQGEIIMEVEHQDDALYSNGVVVTETSASSLQPELLFRSSTSLPGDEDGEEVEGMGVVELGEVPIEGMGSDGEEKATMATDQMLNMVSIIR